MTNIPTNIPRGHYVLLLDEAAPAWAMAVVRKDYGGRMRVGGVWFEGWRHAKPDHFIKEGENGFGDLEDRVEKRWVRAVYETREAAEHAHTFIASAHEIYLRDTDPARQQFVASTLLVTP